MNSSTLVVLKYLFLFICVCMCLQEYLHTYMLLCMPLHTTETKIAQRLHWVSSLSLSTYFSEAETLLQPGACIFLLQVLMLLILLPLELGLQTCIGCLACCVRARI